MFAGYGSAGSVFDEDGESIPVLNLNLPPETFRMSIRVEIGPLRPLQRTLMQGYIITCVGCRAERAGVSTFRIEFVCCRKAKSKVALDL
jgi:hypothetical protein